MKKFNVLYHFVLSKYYLVTSRLRIHIYAKIMSLNMQKST